MISKPRLYVEREIDRLVVEKLHECLKSSAAVTWITLLSAQGHGNTCLLEHLQQTLRRDPIFVFYESLLVHGDMAKPSRPPGPLGPLALAIHHKVAVLGLPWLRRIRRRVRNATTPQLWRCLLVILGGVAAACLFAGFTEYVTSNSQGWRFQHFWSEYLPRNWHNFPVWMTAGSMVSVPLSLVFLYFSRSLMPHPPAEAPGPDEIRELKQDGGLLDALREIAGGRRGVLLLIDDVQWLPALEVNFLNGLLSDTVGSGTPRTLIVALDTEGTNWQERLPNGDSAQFDQLTVSPFDLLELRSVWNAQDRPVRSRRNQKTRGAVSEADLLEQAGGNVKALLAQHDHELAEDMGREFQAAQKDDIASVFGLSTALAFQAARQVPAVAKTELLEWILELQSSGYLEDWGWKAPESPQSLVVRFSHSTLVRTSGDLCSFNHESRSALLAWLQQHQALLLAKAHYFWCRSFLRQLPDSVQPQLAGRLSEQHRYALRSAAWHASRVSLFVDSPAEVLCHAAGLQPEAAAARCSEIISLFLAGVAVHRGEGDLTEARALVSDAIEWLQSCGAERVDLLACAVDQLWRGYWLCGELQLREEIYRSLAQARQMEDAPGWRAHHRCEVLLRGSGSLPPPVEGLADPVLQNLQYVTDVLLSTRQAHGFLAEAMSDIEIEFPEPVVSSLDLLPEWELWSLRIAALNEREDRVALHEAIATWRGRLLSEAPREGRLGEQVVSWLAVALYHHRLLDVWRHDAGLHGSIAALVDEGPPEEVEELLHTACLEEPAPGVDLAEHLWRTSKAAYQRALQIAALLAWRVLVLRASFGLATLLERHTPGSLRQPEGTWWEGWDALLNRCVDLEKELGWIFHRPILHRLRHEFFADEGLESSVEDAYNAFLAAKAACYPPRVVLEWHQKVAGLLNDYGNSETDRKRSAELHKMWARELAALPEAASLRRYSVLRHEQAHGLHFAAQAMRLIGELQEADRLLDEADALVLPAAAEPGEPAEDPERLRELRFSLQLQRAWVRKSQGRRTEYVQLVQDLWRQMRRNDPDCVIVLRSLVQIEAEDRLLDQPWPLLPHLSPLDDPESPELSLPAASPVHVETRYEFRLRQLLSLSGLGAQASLPELILQLQIGWRGGKSFGETAMDLAEFGMTLPLRPQTQRAVIELLHAVWFFFAEVAEVETDELRVLKLLIQYAPQEVFYQERYAAALVKNEHLLKRELAVRETTEQTDWLGLAQRVEHYLRVLVDPDLFAQWLGAALHGDRAEIDQFLAQREQRHGALLRAHASLEGGNFAESLRHLAPVLPTEKPPWVFLEDLKVIDLWMQAHARSGAVSPEEFSRRSKQLRQLALRFVRQFGGLVRDEQVQRLALDLVDLAQAQERAQVNP